MSHRITSFLVLLLATCPVDGPGALAQQANAVRPNVVIILSDDMGFSDLGCFGGEIDTPHLDALADSGVRFTQCYNTARCCPTRASLLTGLYPHQAGMGHMTGRVRPKAGPAYRNDLNRRCVTIAEALRPAGYRSYAVGKWHITPHNAHRPNPNRRNWPLQRGFDRYYGTIAGSGNYYDPMALVRDNTAISPFADPEYKPEGSYYYTDAIADHAARFIDDHAQEHPRQPFFMYVAFTAAHWPLHAPESLIAKYRGRYDAGYDAIREARLAKAKRLGVISDEWPLTPRSGQDYLSGEHREWELRSMETYAAMVDAMDQGVGRIMNALERRQMADNTLVLYLQDNGACAELLGRGNIGRPRPEKPAFPPASPAAIRAEFAADQTRDGYPVRRGVGVMPGPADTYIGYGESWANVSNTPFREYKHWVHEGGISTPLIAHWPAGIQAKGDLRQEPCHLIDLMATCIDIANAPYPPWNDGEPVQPLEGVSLRPAFDGQPLGRKTPIFFEHEGNRAVRDGRWKLVAKKKGDWELYDMDADRTEMHDLADKQPDRVRRMARQWETWARRVNAIPWPWKPPYRPLTAAAASP